MEKLLTLSFTTSESDSALYFDALEPFCLALSSFENPKNPLLWQFEALLEENDVQVAQFEAILQKIAHQHRRSLPSLEKASLPCKNWTLETYQAFPPLTIAGFFIHGSHTPRHSLKGLIPLQIDAATAFGSGEHATTKGCLILLKDLWEDSSSLHTKEASFLDLGTGSGILAFALAKLSQKPVIALDNDPEAIRVTRENAVINNLSHHIHARVSDGFKERQEEELVL